MTTGVAPDFASPPKRIHQQLFTDQTPLRAAQNTVEAEALTGTTKTKSAALEGQEELLQLTTGPASRLPGQAQHSADEPVVPQWEKRAQGGHPAAPTLGVTL